MPSMHEPMKDCLVVGLFRSVHRGWGGGLGGGVLASIIKVYTDVRLEWSISFQAIQYINGYYSGTHKLGMDIFFPTCASYSQ